MTREEFVNFLLRFFTSREEAEDIASDYSDEEILNEYRGIIDDICEDFHFFVALSHYRNHGF